MKKYNQYRQDATKWYWRTYNSIRNKFIGSEWLEIFGVCLVISLFVFVTALLLLIICSIPFALLGWAGLVVANFFTSVAITYFNATMAGVVMAFIAKALLPSVRTVSIPKK